MDTSTGKSVSEQGISGKGQRRKKASRTLSSRLHPGDHSKNQEGKQC